MKVDQKDLVDLLLALGVETAPMWAETGRLEAKINQDEGIGRYVDPPTNRPDDPELSNLYDRIVSAQASGETIEVISLDPAPEREPENETAPEAEAEPDFAQAIPEVEQNGQVHEGAESEPENETAAPPKRGRGRPRKDQTGASPPVRTRKPAASRVSTKSKRVRSESRKTRKPAKSSGRGSTYYGGFKSFKEWCEHLEKEPKPIPEEGITRTLYDELVNAGKGAKPRPVTKEYLLKVLQKKFRNNDADKMWTNINNTVPSRLLWMHGIHVWRYRPEDGGPMGYYIVGNGRKPQPKAVKAAR